MFLEIRKIKFSWRLLLFRNNNQRGHVAVDTGQINDFQSGKSHMHAFPNLPQSPVYSSTVVSLLQTRSKNISHINSQFKTAFPTKS